MWYFFTLEFPSSICFQGAVNFPRIGKIQTSVRLTLHLPVIGDFHSLLSVFNSYETITPPAEMLSICFQGIVTNGTEK